jgi:hypothetical protein
VGFYNTANWPEKSAYYRLPWSNNDNPIAWLEVTDVCNVNCKGCYRRNLSGHRPLADLKKEVDFFIRVRNPDGISIAGGEPLVHPEIVPLVAYIAGKGLKPILISNTVALTRELLRDLYGAGLAGITCHIDMLQDRPDAQPGWTERDLLALRQQKADLLWEVTRGAVNVTFNQTVYHESFPCIPDIVRWARANVRKVHGLVFICYRGMPLTERIRFDAQGVSNEELAREFGYAETDISQIDILSVDVYNLLKDHFGDTYEPCAYLGGTGHIMDYKWLIAASILEGDGRAHGPVGRRTMELLQAWHHWRRGRYFTYLHRHRLPRGAILLTGLAGDRALHRARRGIRRSLLNPANWLRPVYSQSIGIVQAPDMMENGMASMCESCPDMCVWEGNLVNSCRLDEYRRYGRLLNAIVHTSGTEGDKRAAGAEAGAARGGEPVPRRGGAG